MKLRCLFGHRWWYYRDKRDCRICLRCKLNQGWQDTWAVIRNATYVGGLIEYRADGLSPAAQEALRKGREFIASK